MRSPWRISLRAISSTAALEGAVTRIRMAAPRLPAEHVAFHRCTICRMRPAMVLVLPVPGGPWMRAIQ